MIFFLRPYQITFFFGFDQAHALTSTVAYCCQLKFKYRSKLKPHLHYDITLKSQTEKKSKVSFYSYFYFVLHLLF